MSLFCTAFNCRCPWFDEVGICATYSSRNEQEALYAARADPALWAKLAADYKALQEQRARDDRLRDLKVCMKRGEAGELRFHASYVIRDGKRWVEASDLYDGVDERTAMAALEPYLEKMSAVLPLQNVTFNVDRLSFSATLPVTAAETVWQWYELLEKDRSEATCVLGRLL
jgi:hypothetical protein